MGLVSATMDRGSPWLSVTSLSTVSVLRLTALPKLLQIVTATSEPIMIFSQSWLPLDTCDASVVYSSHFHPHPEPQDDRRFRSRRKRTGSGHPRAIHGKAGGGGGAGCEVSQRHRINFEYLFFLLLKNM